MSRRRRNTASAAVPPAGRPTVGRATLPRAEVGSRRHRWPPKLLALLGKVPDSRLAARAGINFQAVAAERRRRRIPPARKARPRVAWTPAMIALLGTASDAEVGRVLAIASWSVAYKRAVLGIPPHSPPPHDRYARFPWRPEDLALLGRLSDGEIARILGLAPSGVNRKRKTLGIPPFQEAHRAVDWTPEKIERLGKVSDARAAQALGVAVQTVSAKRRQLGIPAWEETRPVLRSPAVAKLLDAPTREIERRTGLDRATIDRLRRDLGVEEPVLQLPSAFSFDRSAAGKAPTRGPGYGSAETAAARPRRNLYRWHRLEIELLGTAPDAEIAARLGRSKRAVAAKRGELGIRFREVRAWRAKERALLHTRRTHVELAARLGRTANAVRMMRRKLRIPSARRR